MEATNKKVLFTLTKEQEETLNALAIEGNNLIKSKEEFDFNVECSVEGLFDNDEQEFFECMKSYRDMVAALQEQKFNFEFAFEVIKQALNQVAENNGDIEEYFFYSRKLNELRQEYQEFLNENEIIFEEEVAVL